MSIKTIAFRIAPYWLQDAMVTAYNSLLYRQRYSGAYSDLKGQFKNADQLPEDIIEEEAKNRLEDFLAYAKSHSSWYRGIKGNDLSDFPVLEKEHLVTNLNEIRTIDEREAIVSLTGGTTGASLKVYYTKRDIQERFAILDAFREQYGHRLGRRTAWFSGKHLATEADVVAGRCYRDDFINKIRFFSTYHISTASFEVYWRALEDFSPEYIVGFPSSVYEICRVAQGRGLRMYPKVSVFFPTAETVLPMHREVIKSVLGCKLIDQYASSEGAPFILECPNGSLHINSLTGVFEVVDDDMRPAEEGELLVTSFTTHGTPLIRYRIGDCIALERPDFKCDCGSSFPVVKWIEGRTNDFLWSTDGGKVNLGNISNCTKDVRGIITFQIKQETLTEVSIRAVVNSEFDESAEELFLEALRLRLGSSMRIEIDYVDDIPRENSGKFRMVINNVEEHL